MPRRRPRAILLYRAMTVPRAAVIGAALLLAACGAQTPSPTADADSSPEAPNLPNTPRPTRSAALQPTPEAPSAFAGAWVEITESAIGPTADWTNKVELADLNGDGHVDILFANGGDYESPGEPVSSQAWLNAGTAAFTDATAEILGDYALITRVIKVGDLNADGFPDILMGTTYQSQSQLRLSDGQGGWTDATASNLPQVELSVGDLELGDIDGDGDLDVVLADWGDASPMQGAGLVQLWLNDGNAVFTDATAEQMPDTLVGFSWDLELVDVDNDWDLDVAVSCKTCSSSLLYLNDGAGTFTDVSADRMPAFTNNYEFAPIDLDGDGFLDLVTINDGTPGPNGLREHVFRNDGDGSFQDVTEDWWPDESNAGWDDNVVVALDVDSDGDVDFLVGSLDGPDRLLLNDGSGRLTLVTDSFDAPPSGGTLGMAVADLNGDGRPDVVEAQGEVPGHQNERVYLGTDVLSPDTAPPIIRMEVVGAVAVARVHDNRTANMPHDWQSVTVRWDGGETPMIWYGENLFRASLPDGVTAAQVCATDVAGNDACSG